jgi:hypothetical protein
VRPRVRKHYDLNVSAPKAITAANFTATADKESELTKKSGHAKKTKTWWGFPGFRWWW